MNRIRYKILIYLLVGVVILVCCTCGVRSCPTYSATKIYDSRHYEIIKLKRIACNPQDSA